MTLKLIEENVLELIQRQPFVRFVFEMLDGPTDEVLHPHLSVDDTGAGFLGGDGSLVDVNFNNVRAIRLLNREAVA